MSTAALKRFTVDEYFALETDSETKHEFFDGEIFAMAGANEPHNLIVGNSVTTLNNALKDSPCRVYPSDLRVRCPRGLYTYPDVTVVCAEPEFEDDRRNTLLNPLILFEVLSDSTEAYDRGKKFEQYRSLPSLAEYVLISQDRHLVEHFARQDDAEHWLLTSVSDPAGIIELPAIDGRLALSEIYAKVEFPEEPTENGAEPAHSE